MNGAALLAAGVALGAAVAFVATSKGDNDRIIVVGNTTQAPGSDYGQVQQGPSLSLESSVTDGVVPRGLAPEATRGAPPSYRQVGILTKRGDNPDAPNGPTILPLFGRPAYRGAQQWYYYCASDKFHLAKLPVSRSGGGGGTGRECSKEPGCVELQEGDVVFVFAYKAEFDFTRYNTGPTYEP